MASAESINRLLAVASSLLNYAAAEIRDAKFEPVRENIEHIGRALAEVFEIQHRIYSLHPELTPSYLTTASQDSEANRLLSEHMFRASEFERAGDIQSAIAEFARFLELESSPLHREIATGEIERLKNEDQP